MLLWIHFTDACNQELLCGLLRLILDPLVVRLAEPCELFERFNITSVLVSVVIELETVRPACLVQIQEHLLFTLVFAIVDSD